MPQVSKNDQSLTPTNVQESKSFGERLRSRFKPTQFVRVMNIDDEPFTWQWMPDDGEETTMSTDGMMRSVVGRKAFVDGYSAQVPGNEQTWELGSGETETILGANAYIMIEGLFKRLVAKKAIKATPNQEATKARNFNWNDGLLQEQMIDKIFLGIETPTFNETRQSTETSKKA